MRAECYVCAVDVGVGECAGGLCVCVVGRVCVRFGGSGGVCVCLQKRGPTLNGRRDEVRTTDDNWTDAASDDATSSRSKLMALAAAWRDGFCRSAATASAK